MFLPPSEMKNKVLSFPRARGDVPVSESVSTNNSLFSPRTRGCSHSGVHVPDEVDVFPAHAGMFRRKQDTGSPPLCFPRARGDVPMLDATEIVPLVFSPRTRGCSGLCDLC